MTEENIQPIEVEAVAAAPAPIEEAPAPVEVIQPEPFAVAP